LSHVLGTAASTVKRK